MTVREGDIVRSARWWDACIETPGHTAGHISYWFKADKLAFVGDTLFSVGCGRIIEGNAEMMWQSLLKFRNLPARHAIYCGHEYTAANVHFALPSSRTTRRCERAPRRSCGSWSRRSPRSRPRSQQEKSYNPFLRADLHPVAASVGMEGAPAGQVFGDIRARKDNFSQLHALPRLPPTNDPRCSSSSRIPRAGTTARRFGTRAPMRRARGSTAIYFLLARGERSHWHRVDAVEIWHYHAGAPLVLESPRGAGASSA